MDKEQEHVRQPWTYGGHQRPIYCGCLPALSCEILSPNAMVSINIVLLCNIVRERCNMNYGYLS